MVLPSVSTGSSQDSQSDGWTVYVETVSIVALCLLAGLVWLDGSFGVGGPRAVGSFLVFAVVPGVLWLTLFGFGPRRELRWLLYAVGTSLLVIMAVGFGLAVTLPPLGVDRPLAAAPLAATHSILIVGLSAIIRLTDPDGRRLEIPEGSVSAWLSRWLSPTPLALLLLPLATILSVHWLNVTGDNRPVIVLLAVIAVVPLAIAVGVVGRQWLSVGVGAVGVSLLYHDAVWQLSRFSGQGNIVDAWESGRWAISHQSAEAAATTPLLANVTLSPTFAQLSGVDILVQLELINPLVVALIPLGSFVLFRRFVDPVEAALGAILVTFIHPFYSQLPAGGRAAMPVLFLVFTTVALTDSDLQPVLREGLAVGFAAAVVTSHYGAAYFVMGGLVSGLVLLVGLRLLDTVRFGPLATTQPDGGSRHSRLRAVFQQQSALSVSFVAFYVVLSFAWYLYTFNGQKVTAFFSRIQEAVSSFLVAGAGGGGTANRLTREYGAAAIELSRTLYVLLAALSALGVCWLIAKRMLQPAWRDRDGFDEYLAVGVGMLAVFSLTFVLRSIWGGGRPMAIAFSVTAVFAVVGVHALVESLVAGWHRLGGHSLPDGTTVRTTCVLFATLLGVLLLLNTGVASATVLGGTAPSSVPLQPAIEQRADESPADHQMLHADQEIAMFVWLTAHADGETEAFGDETTRQHHNDIYDPQIAAGVPPGDRQSVDWTPDLFAVVEYTGDAYVVRPSYSVSLGVAESPASEQYSGARSYQRIDAVNDRLVGEHKIYTNGDSDIHRTVDRDAE